MAIRGAEIAALVLACSGMMAACGGDTPGQLTPASTITTTSPSPSSVSALPPRPRNIKIDTLDPCKVLSPDQQKQLGLDRPPKMDPDERDQHGNKSCLYSKSQSEPTYGYLVIPVLQEGADVWLREKRNADVKMIDPVEGFGAVSLSLQGPDEKDVACSVVIDITQGQSLKIQFANFGRELTFDQMCAKAREGAEQVMQTILSVA